MIWTQGRQAAFTLASCEYWSIERFAIQKEIIGKSSHIEVSGRHSVLSRFNLNFIDQSGLFFPTEQIFYICFGHCEGKCISKSNWYSCGSDIKIKLSGHCKCDYGHVPILLKTWVFWTMEDQDKNQRYYLRMPVMLVFCFVVMIFSVLCLLDVLHFIISLSEICLRTGKQRQPYYKMSLIVGSTVKCHCRLHPRFPWKWAQLMWFCVGD